MPVGAVVEVAAVGMIDTTIAATKIATETARRRPVASGNDDPSYRDGAVSAPSDGERNRRVGKAAPNTVSAFAGLMPLSGGGRLRFYRAAPFAGCLGVTTTIRCVSIPRLTYFFSGAYR